MSLYLAHGRDMALRNLMMILHVVLQRLIVIVLHLFARHAPHFRELVRLVIGLGHGYLVLGVEGQLAVAALEFGHEGRRQRWFALGALGHGREISLAAAASPTSGVLLYLLLV